MQIRKSKKNDQKCIESWIWEGLGLHLGRVWDGLGTLLGALGRLWLIFWGWKSSFCKALVQDGLQEAFWIDFGAILGGFREVLGRIWTNFWRDFGRIGGRTWKSIKKCGHNLQYRGLTLHIYARDPRADSLPRSVTILFKAS